MKRVLLAFCCLLGVISSQGQTYTTINSGTSVVNTGAAYSVPFGFFVDNGSYTDTTSPGSFNCNGGVTFQGSGATLVYDLNMNSGANDMTAAQVSVYNTATLASGVSLDAGSGNLWLRTDIHYATANLVNNGLLTGTVTGLETYATATTGFGPSYTSTLSDNVSGTSMVYQWQSSPDNLSWTPVTGATNATYTATVTASIYYRCLLTTSNTAYSQTTPGVLLTICTAPTITAVSPLAGYPASTATITGTGFDATATNDVVFFGATQATVTAASSTSLSVTVPTDATFNAVTVNNLTCFLQGYSPKPFLPYYNNAAYVSATENLDPNVAVPDGSSADPLNIAIGDFDGDGKSDMAVANFVANNITVFPNISTSGTLTPGSFGTPVIISGPGGGTCSGVAAADLDGDGKLDLAFVSRNSVVSVVRNQSSPGAISFGARTDFAVGFNNWDVKVADIDMDGQPDLIVSNFSSNTISVLRNTAVNGVLNSSSFAAQVTFATGNGPFNIAVGDIDGDGKPDVVVPNRSANTIGIFRNTSTPGVINTGSLASMVAFTAGAGPYAAAIGDIDGDGSLDVAVSNWGTNTISLFRNTASSGVINSGSLAAKIDFTVGLHPTGLAIGDIDGDSKPDVVTANYNSPNVSVLRNISTSGSISFANKVDFSTGSGSQPAWVSIADLDGDGKADLAVSEPVSSSIILLRNDPLKPISGAATVCAGSNITLVEATPNGMWSSSNTAVATVGSTTGTVAGVSVGTATITYSGTSGTSILGNYTTYDITVNPTPVMTVTPTFQAVCNNTSTAAVAFNSSVGGTTYTWTNSDPTIGIGASGSGSSIASFTATNTGTTPATGVFTVTPTANGCTGATQNFSIVVSPTPIMTVTPTSQTICNNSNTSTEVFTSNVGTTTYAWNNNNTTIGIGASGAGSLIASFLATNTGTAPASGVFTVTPTANGCPGPVMTFTITVNPTPVMTVTPTAQTVCNNANTSTEVFTSNVTGTTFTWANNNTTIGIGASGSGSSIASFTATNTGTTATSGVFTVTPTANSCAGPVQTFTISVNPTPNMTVAPIGIGGQTVCNGASTVTENFNCVVSGTTYTWTNNNTSIGIGASGSGSSIAPFTAANSGSSPTSGVFSVTPTANGCVGPVKTFTITVNPTPIMTVTPTSQAVCNNANTSTEVFTSNVTGTTFTWANNNTTIGIGASGSGSLIASFTAANTGTTPASGVFTVTPTANSCAGPVKTFTITVNPTPIMTVTPTSQTVCNNANTSAEIFTSNVTGTAYTWANNNTTIGIGASGSGSIIASFTATNTGATLTSGVFTVSPTANSCTGPVQTFTISVNPTPVMTVTPTAQTVCNNANTSAEVFTSNVTGTTYTWTNNNPSIGIGASGSGSIIASFTATNTGTTPTSGVFTVSPTANSCAGSVKTFTITVNPTPIMTVTPTSQTVCNNANTSTEIFTSNVTGSTYTWANNNPTIGIGVSGSGSAIASFTATNTGSTLTSAVFTVTPQANACAGPQQTFTVSVNPSPNVGTTGGGIAVCSGSTATLSGTGAVSYSWTGGITNGLAFTPAVGVHSYTVTGTDINSCTNTAVTTVTVNALPPISAGPGIGICYTYSTALTATGGLTYSWSPATGLSATTGAVVTAGPLTTTTYTLTGSDAFCTNTATITVSVNPLPVISAGSGVIACPSTPTPITATGGATYTWSPATGLSATTGATVYTTITSNTIYTVTGTVSGCSDTASVPVTVRLFGFDNGSPQAFPVCNSSIPVSLSNLLKASNATGGGFTYTVVSGPSHGTLTGFPATAPAGISSMPGGTYYQPTYAYAGPDAFTIQVTDGTCTITTVINITVLGAMPAPVSMTGGGGYCTGGSGVNVGLTGSVGTVSYQLYRGTTPVGGLIPGIGMALNFGLQTVAGTYTATATNTTTGCTIPMLGSVNVIVYPLPNIYNVTGGGSYCTGGAGVTIGVSNSDIGVNYQLYRAGLPLVGVVVAGTGSAISFPLQTAAGTYTVVAKNASFTGCTQNMTGSATVSLTALPTAYSVTGTGSYCVGGTGTAVGLSNSDPGVNYQLYSGSTAIGSPVAGTGSAISFGLQTAGTYTVKATDATSGCVNTMTGSAAITTTALPSVYSMTGGGSFCIGGAGVPVGLNTSTGGISYQLYNGTTAVGSPVTGTGTPIAFGLQTATGAYTAVATNPATGCVSNMSGAAVVSTIALPTAYTVTGGGAYCTGGTGVHVGLSSSATGVSYQLYLGSTATGSPLAGTGSALDFGLKTAVGVYTVTASVTGTFCTSTMTGSATVSVNTLPAVYAMTGGGAACTGGTGVAVGLSGSQSGVNYQLFLGTTAVGSSVAGTGSAISFGLQATAGTYTATATNTTTSCVSNMTGTASVTSIALPTAYTVTGGGGYCTGGTGVVIGLSGSQTGVSYQLYLGGSASGSPLAGTGSALNFGLHTAAGTYTVVATASSSGCTNNMTGSATIAVSGLPTVYSVTGGGSYCAGGTGVSIGLTGSDIGVNYQLLRGTTLVGSTIAGTGSAITFPSQTVAGTYTVTASNASSGCSNNMSGSATVSINAAPAAYAMTGGGGYCTGGTGLHVGLAGSATGVNYQLFLGTTAVGSPLAGTGLALDFGLQTATGIYTVTATNTGGCTTAMTGSVTVSVYVLPGAYTLTGGGSLCAGGAGVHVGLSGSATGVTYKLFRGTSSVASTAGTGSALDFGIFTTGGTYTVTAIATGSGCVTAMTGSATITVNPVPTITGSTFILAPGGTTTLTGSVSGGTWTSTATGVVTVGSSTGVVTGVGLGTATISYTLTTGCAGTHVFSVTASGHRESPSATTTTQETTIGNIIVSPNPNHGAFTIKGSLGIKDDQVLSIQVTNMLGQVVYDNKVLVTNGELNETVQLDGRIANGMYLLSLHGERESKMLHIVIEQ